VPTLRKIKEQKMTGIYFDNNATTRVDEKVVEAMLPYFTEQFGNPSSMHSFGNKVGLAIKKARMQVRNTTPRSSSPPAAPSPTPPRSSPH
jgi:selenocysteine lyase/cysteine desulfurase